MPAKKTITFLSRHAPYGCHNPQLCLDMALAYAVFEQRVNYVFLGDGVYQLMKQQNSEAIKRKSIGSALETLELYGIENILVDGESLQDRVLQVTDLVLPAKVVSRTEISQLLQKSDTVFNL